jgi:hypothetical protein
MKMPVLPISFLIILDAVGKSIRLPFYRDADDADWQKNPESYIIEKQTVTSTPT